MRVSSSPEFQVRLFAFITALCVACDAMLYAALPVHLGEAGLSSLFEAGLALSVNRLVRLPANPLVGRICAMTTPNRCMLGAALLSAAVTAGYAFASGLAAWLVLRACWGVAWSFLKTASMVAAVHYGGSSGRGRMLGLFSGTWQMGALAGMIAGALAADTLGLRASAALFIPVVLAAAPCCLLLAPVPRPETPAGMMRRLASEFKSRGTLPALATAALTACILQGVFASSLGVLVKAHLGSSGVLPFMAAGAATTAGMLQALRCMWEPFLAPAAGRLADRSGPALPYGAFALAAAPAFLMLACNLPPWLWLAAAVAFEIFCTALTSLGEIIVCSGPGGNTLERITACTIAVDTGAAAGPAAGFLLADLFGIDAVAAFSALLLGAAGAAWLLKALRRSGRSER